MTDNALSLEILGTQIKADQQRVNERVTEFGNVLSSLRQNGAEQRAVDQQLAASVADIVKSATGKPSGPTDAQGAVHALRNPASRQEAVQLYGAQWLVEVKEKQLWPTSALHDDDFFAQYLELNESGMADPPAASLPTTSVHAELPASASNPAIVSKAASDCLPTVPATSIAGTPFPFAAALAGRLVKVELPKPSKFSRIAVDCDIRAWLLQMHKYLTTSGIETSVWVVFASNFLERAPLQLWEARKRQLTEQPEVLYSWNSFKEWCISNFDGARKHPRSQPSTASARLDRRPRQRRKFNDYAGKPEQDTRLATWSNDRPEDFTCQLDGWLKEPLPQFFKQWIDGCTRSASTGKPLLPTGLLREGKLETGHCYYKGCNRSGHRWDQCPRLAVHVAKNPALANLLAIVSLLLHLLYSLLRPTGYGLKTGSMTCLKRFTKGAALFEQSTRSGSMASSPSLNWPVYIFTDVQTAAYEALGRGQSMHRLHNATVLAASHDSDLESDERLAMLFEGSFLGDCIGRGGSTGGSNGGQLTAPILFDNLPILSILDSLKDPSSATLRLADDSSAPILGKVRLRFKLQSFILLSPSMSQIFVMNLI
ncbi:TPA: hypothetical protein ACH3X1_008153 [Trebouxia sp. C0004]